jgi:adenosylcobinamide kinase/adenosylcobinamide-phosphate guanylyltransferase
MGRLTFILGGARSGKSTIAEQLALQSSGKVLFIATAQALDEEMKTRIEAHQAKRPPNWHTLELPNNLARELSTRHHQANTILLDCITLLVSNLLVDTTDANTAQATVMEEINTLLGTIKASSAEWIVVSNEVGLGLVPPYPLGRQYRDLLGWTNQQFAKQAEKVIFMIAGIPWQLPQSFDPDG